MDYKNVQKKKEEIKMKNKGLTVTAVFEAESANYGEGYNNITTLKKLTRGDGNTYSYISRQALRYNIIEQMKCNNTPVEAIGSGEKKVIQFSSECTITDYPEIDLFGYMKTEGGKGATTRSAVVRLSNAISLEEFEDNTDFLTNMGLAKRIEAKNSIAQSEIHKSYYAYTVTIDLDKIGIDKEVEIEENEKKKRVRELLKTIQFLYRDIKGRRENLTPIFIIGGIYDRKNPFFENRIKVKQNKLNTGVLTEIIESETEIKENTKVGYLKGTFNNDSEIQEELKSIKVNEFFDDLIKRIEEEC
jgi:CRISPR-associated protein Cst2